MSNDTQPEIRFPGFTEDWEQRRLSDVASIVGGGTPSTSNPEYWDGDIDWYAPAEIGDQIYVSKSLKTITELGQQKSSAKILPIGTVLFTSRAGIGNTAILAKEGTTNQGFQSIVPHKNKLDSYFIFSRTHELKRYGEVTGAGSTFAEVSGKQMAKMPILIPCINEQRKIGAFFEQLDTTITLHQRKLDLLKETKKGFLQKMFPKNGAKVPEIRFPGFTKDWEERKLGSIYDFSKGKGLPLNSFTYSKDDPAIAYGHLYTKYSEVISEVYLSSDDDGVLSKDNDLLFPGSSTVPNGTAQANAIMLNNVKLGGDIIIARPKQDTRVLSIFMSYQINSQRQKLFPITVGTTITHMYGKDLSKVKFFITNYSEQQKIGSFFKQLDDTIALHQRKLDLLKETKKGFLQKMFV